MLKLDSDSLIPKMFILMYNLNLPIALLATLISFLDGRSACESWEAQDNVKRGVQSKTKKAANPRQI